MSKLRIGVFGGFRGETMIRVLLAHPEAELVAVCDKYVPLLEKAASLAKELGTKVAVYENFEGFIRHDMDAVVLANYAHEHATYAIRALESGRHVLSEVLPCETMSQAVALVEAVESTGLIYAYAENYAYMDQKFEIWRRYRRGDIGEVTYAECEYVHDCASIWPQITYGDRTHWRNRMHPFFYCTHSLGPILAITGRRPVKVIGLATPPDTQRYLKALGPGMAGVEMVTLDNGAIVKSIHGELKREPESNNCAVYGTRGCMETQRFGEAKINVYTEGENACKGTLETYVPDKFVNAEFAKNFGGHRGADSYPTHFFIQRILGRPEGRQYSIDVHQAVGMGICGILAYRSNLNGSVPVDVPDLRDPAQREAFRNDNASTTPEVAGNQLLPRFLGSGKMPRVSDEAYTAIERLWREGKPYEK